MDSGKECKKSEQKKLPENWDYKKKQIEAQAGVEKYGGLWITVEQMINYLENLSKKDKKLAVKANIKYHKVFTKINDKKLIIMRKQKDKPLKELIDNLKILINMPQEDTQNDNVYDYE
uniref:Uncharacterized protein n=1 Tax=Panagrolaimus superbus TaxID=310955 RepID=A0A914YSE3_9BILA